MMRRNAAMFISGGTALSEKSTLRRRNLIESWRPEVVHGWARRAQAIQSAGGIAIAQFVHLGRETLGAETWWALLASVAVTCLLMVHPAVSVQSGIVLAAAMIPFVLWGAIRFQAWQ